MKAPIALALFASTKGHHGHRHIYKTTINDLFAQLGHDFFESKVVHIKREQGDEGIFIEMSSYFSSHNFTVITTFGAWKHYDQSHYIEHAKDIITLMSSKEIQKSKYVFWLEDDFLLRSHNSSLLKKFKMACDFLDSNPNILNVRFLKNENDESLLMKDSDFGEIYNHKDVYSFNPNLIRSRDAWILARLFERNYFHNLNIHIERFATESLRAISDTKNPSGIFSCFKLDFAQVIHIGEPNYYFGIEKQYKIYE